MINNILKEYSIEGSKIEKIHTGLINETYKITCSDNKYILQKLNSIYSFANLQDMDSITKHVNQSIKILPSLIKTKDGKLGVNEGPYIWRLIEYIDGDVYESTNSETQAFECGKILGLFHKALKNFSYEFKSDLGRAHQSRKTYERLITTLNEYKIEDEIKPLIVVISEIEKHFIDKKYRMVITHSDPKISNMIFSNNKAIALIDLDGCRDNYLFLELGDALRSWCGKEEDDQTNTFDMRKFTSALNGYMDSAGSFIKKEELLLVPQSIKVITLGLASRFLRDYYVDSYFGWNNKKYSSRKEHNLERVKSQLNLYADLVKKDLEINKVINTLIDNLI